MNGLSNNTGPETTGRADGTYESFLDYLRYDGQYPQTASWDSFFKKPIPSTSQVQPRHQMLSTNQQPYIVNSRTYGPTVGVTGYGYESAVWAGHGSVGDTAHPPHTQQWHPEMHSVDDLTNRPTEGSSSVFKTDQNSTIQEYIRSPSPDILPYPTGASSSPSPVPSPVPQTITNIAASGSMPPRCLWRGCFGASGAPILNNRHKDTTKHKKQQLSHDRIKVPIYECPGCGRAESRLHTLLRHMESRYPSCASEHPEFMEKGKPGRPKGSKSAR